jgi:hypothetical protein
MTALRRRAPRAIHAGTALGVVILAVPTLVVLTASLTTGNNIVFPPHGLTFEWYGKLVESGFSTASTSGSWRRWSTRSREFPRRSPSSVPGSAAAPSYARSCRSE